MNPKRLAGKKDTACVNTNLLSFISYYRGELEPNSKCRVLLLTILKAFGIKFPPKCSSAFSRLYFDRESLITVILNKPVNAPFMCF